MSGLLASVLTALLGLGPALGFGGFETVAERPPQPPGAVAQRPPQPPASSRLTSDLPLSGRIIVVDAGHQLGNRHFPKQINRFVEAGGFKKPCNTTGTATNGGYPEATFTWKVATKLKVRLETAGAAVLITRTSNRQDRWGPCVDVRGRAGNGKHADLKISIHGDGSTASGAHGFHVIYAPDRAPWTDDTFVASERLAGMAKDSLIGKGFSVANYIAGGDGIDVRSDLGTLNLSDVPTVMVELGNMRNAADAAIMISAGGQGRCAAALAKAARLFLR